MKVLVQIDYAGELQARTVGYRGQDASIVVPLLTTAVAAALQREQARREQRQAIAEDLVAAGAAAVITSDVVVEAEAAAPLALVPAVPGEPVAPAPARARRRPSAPPQPRRPPPEASAAAVEELERKRIEALTMLDSGMLAEVIADELGVSAGQVRRWDRGNR